MKKKRKWELWENKSRLYYVIAKAECPNREDVKGWIVDNLPLDILDGNNPMHLSIDDIQEGWGQAEESRAGNKNGAERISISNKPIPGWFTVWIVQKRNWGKDAVK